jgi:lipopolysaccharide export system protein LptC
LYNRKTSILSLTRNVVLKSSAGFEMHLDEAIVDTGSGEVVSNKPVAVFTQDATLNAERLEVERSGDVVRFIGGVVMNLNAFDKPKQPAANR